MKLHTNTGTLTPTPPFDFAKSLAFLGEFPPTLNEQTVSAYTLTKSVFVAGQCVAFQLRSVGTVEKPRLAYTLWAKQAIDDATHQAAQDRIAFFLSLAEDLKPFYVLAQKDKLFTPVIQHLYGLHQVKFLTPFENACWAVLSQRAPISIAQQMKQAIVEKFGDHLSVDGTAYWAFPDAARLAVVAPDELAALIRNERKATYLSAVARKFDSVSEEYLRTSGYAEVRQWLLNIKGIGEWSADFILLRGLGRMEQLHVQSKSIFERRLGEAVGKVYARGKPMNGEAILKIAERYGEWQGYWAYYLRTAE